MEKLKSLFFLMVLILSCYRFPLPKNLDKTLVKEANVVLDRVKIKLEDTEFKSLITYGGTEEKIIANEILELDTTRVKAIYKIIIDEYFDLTQLQSKTGFESLDVSKFSYELQEEFRNQVISSIPNFVNQNNGESHLMLLPVLKSSNAFAFRNFENYLVLVIVYEDSEYSGIITYNRVNDEVVIANGGIVKTPSIYEVSSALDMNYWFYDYFSGVSFEVEEIE